MTIIDRARTSPPDRRDVEHQLRRFYVSTFCWTWAIWIPLVYFTNATGDVTEMDLPMWLALGLLMILQLGAYGPSVMALVFSMHRLGGEGVGNLLSRLVCWRVHPIWYAIALLLPALIQLLTILAYTTLSTDARDSVGDFDQTLAPQIVSNFLLILLFGPLAEELGWRGYALPRLLEIGSAVQASVVMGLLATLWHVPLFLATFPPVEGVAILDVTFVYYAAYTIGRCFLYTWIFENTRGSVLMTILFHAAGNVGMPFVLLSGMTPETRSEITLWSSVGMWILAAVIVRICGVRSFRMRSGPRTD